MSPLFLPPATKLGQGNIFSSVCQEFCPQGGVPGQDNPPPTPKAGTPLGRLYPGQVHTPPGRYPIPPHPRAVHALRYRQQADVMFCDIQLRSTIQWIQPVQPVFLLRKQHSIQRYNGLCNWFDRNWSSNGLDQRCQDLRSLPKLEDKSGIDLQLSSIQGPLQSRSRVTYDCGWVTQASPSSGIGRT